MLLYIASAPTDLNDYDIKRVTNTKLLGIIVDEGLNWERQYKTVHYKSDGSLQSLRGLKSILPSILIKHCISSPN